MFFRKVIVINFADNKLSVEEINLDVRERLKMKHSKVSVVIPVYNMELYLAETLESVLKSDYPNFEVIVMDDESTDKSLSIAEHYREKDRRISIYSQPNQGASAARNNAIKTARGCYILPVDADNLISDNYISEAAKTLDENPEVKLVSSEAEYIGDKSGRWKFEQFSINLLCRRNLVDNCSMYRKSDWESVGGYCNEILGREDWDFWLSLFKSGGKFIRLPIVGLYYRVRPNSKKARTRHLYKDIIDAFNTRHKPLFYKELRGKLHYQRTHSKVFNTLISWFRPHNIYSKTSNPTLEKLVYLANEENIKKDQLKLNDETVECIQFKEKRFHIPGTKIKKSKARNRFNISNNLHLGYNEEQTSLFSLNSYLIKKAQ